ncbi:hypothetical protein HJG60_011259 [Phyllostomus discolor]|uniref:Uncharacterized protein n=1 Tax=Phyllostomus discolor TaxID=89673 RepID=A0A834E589_9CHIR|nr:hypothetical protein HJG60_011259 [Phyllostomus discolor]
MHNSEVLGPGPLQQSVTLHAASCSRSAGGMDAGVACSSGVATRCGQSSIWEQPLLLHWLRHLELAPEDVQTPKLEPALLPGLVLELEEEKKLVMCLPFQVPSRDIAHPEPSRKAVVQDVPQNIFPAKSTRWMV